MIDSHLTALKAADDWYRVEDTNLTRICFLGGLETAACEQFDRDHSNSRSSSSGSNHHAVWKAGPNMTAVTWDEACRADERWARAAYALATRLGYEYNNIQQGEDRGKEDLSWCLLPGVRA